VRPKEVIPPLRSLRGGDVGDRWALDVAGPFPIAEGGQRYVIAALEYVTRYAVATTVVQHTVESVADFLLSEVVLRFGPFRELLTDGATELTGKTIDRWCRCAGETDQPGPLLPADDWPCREVPSNLERLCVDVHGGGRSARLGAVGQVRSLRLKLSSALDGAAHT